MSHFSYEVLVSQNDDEDLSWLRHHIPNTIVYSKSIACVKSSSIHPDLFKSVKIMPELYSHAHTCIHDMISEHKNYILQKESMHPNSSSSKVIKVFTKGNISKDVPPEFIGNEATFLDVLLLQAVKYGVSMNAHNHKGAHETIKFAHSLNNLACTGMVFGEWYRNFINPSHALRLYYDDIYWFQGSVFAVDRRLILQHDISYYQRIHEFISVSKDTECEYFLERSWFHMFSKSKPQPLLCRLV